MAPSNSPDLWPHRTPLPHFGLRTSDFGLWTYLDHDATTPILPWPRRGFFILHSSFSEEWGNPSSACKFESKLKGVVSNEVIRTG